MELNGTLDQFPLSELVVMMQNSSVTGVLQIGSVPNASYLCCRDGRVYHAVCNAQSGMTALRQIIEGPAERFHFISGAASETVTLFLEAPRLAEYVALVEQLLRQARPHVTDTTMVPVLRVSEQPVQVDMLTWQVLAAIDGERSIDGIATLLAADPLEISAVVGRLIERHLAMLQPPHPAPRPVFISHTGSPPTPPTNGLMARVMSGIATADERPTTGSPFPVQCWWGTAQA